MKTRHLLISASAGSGKTYRLVHHFLGVVYNGLLARDRDRQPQVVERILAATFTRAAAGEIVDRILKRVAQSMLDPRERSSLCAELGADDIGEEGCGAMLQALVSKLHRLRVGTLDSFLVRSAQAFATELGMPGNWNILDGPADMAVCLEAIDAILVEKAADPVQFPLMLDLLVALNQGRWPLQVRGRLAEYLRSAQFALTAGPAEAWEVIAPDPGKLVSPPKMAQLLDAFVSDGPRFMPLTKKGSPNANYVNAARAVVEKARVSAWEELLTAGLVCTLGKATPAYHSVDLEPGLIALLQPLRDHAGACLLAMLHDRNISTRALLREFVREYHRAKSARAAYRFEDFTDMLLAADVTENLGDFYYRLDGQIDHILLDEFQDTSTPQWKLIKPLVEEIMSGEGGGGGGRTFFCVGDVKQTLYGWRNAEPRLLSELAACWPNLAQDYLLQSHRSSPVIIDTVNEIFRSIARNPALVTGDGCHQYMAEAAALWSAWFKEHSTARANVPGFCRLITCEDGDCAADLQICAINLAAKRASELHEAQPEAEIAILVRRRKFIPRALARLRQLEIPASGEGGSPLADDMAVCTVLSLLHLIDHPSDTAAIFHVGASPLGAALGIGQSPAAGLLKTANALRAEILDGGLGAAINRWLGLCATQCDARNFRRLRQLIELAHGFDYDGGDLRPFIDSVRGSSVEDTEASKVRVMTIHASKGRQFDYVILPDLDGNLLNLGPPVLLRRGSLLSAADCITTRPSTAQAAVDERLGEMDAEWKRRQIVEELCALYVALTRAKSGMEMIVHPQSANAQGKAAFPKSPAGVLRGALADATAAASSVLWSHSDSVLPEGIGGVRENSNASAPPIHIHVTPAGRDSRLRPVVAPSSLEGSGYIHLGQALSFSQDYAVGWGKVMHRWFELIEWLQDAPPSDAVLRAAAQKLPIPLSRGKIDSMIPQFHEYCEAPHVSALLRKETYIANCADGETLELWRERAFAVPLTRIDSTGVTLVGGRIDRVVIVRAIDGKATRAEVVDYKTDQLPARSAAEKASHYAPQVRAYRQAVASLLGLSESAVTAKLAFVGADVVVDA